MTKNDVILEVNDLHTYFFNRRGITKAVDGVSFSLRQAEDTVETVGDDPRFVSCCDTNLRVGE